jgi:hypothetical protein
MKITVMEAFENLKNKFPDSKVNKSKFKAETYFISTSDETHYVFVFHPRKLQLFGGIKKS